MVKQVQAWADESGKLYYQKIEAARADARVALRTVLGDAVNEASLNKIVEAGPAVYLALHDLAEAEVVQEADTQLDPGQMTRARLFGADTPVSPRYLDGARG